MSEAKKEKEDQLDKIEKYNSLVRQIHNLSKKLMNLSPNHRTAAYWEQLNEDTGELLKLPLD